MSSNFFLLGNITRSWEDKLKKSQGVLEQHKKMLDDHGASVTSEQGGSGLKLESKLPHLVSLSQELDFSITIYTLHEGTTRVGRENQDPPQDVIIWGVGVEDEHCSMYQN